MTFILSPLALDRELVLDFFWKFSSFECALKREGFLRATRSGAAEADWARFGSELSPFAHVAVPGFQESVRELNHLAPMRQVVREGKLAWEPIARHHGESADVFTLRLLKTARNNLFHGGKYPDGPIHEIARDRKILIAAIKVLDGCYEIHAGVRRRIDAAA